MKTRAIAALLLLSGSLAFAGVSVIVPYEDDTVTTVDKHAKTEEQKRNEALFQERLKQREAERLEEQKRQETFQRDQREKREEIKRQKALKHKKQK